MGSLLPVEATMAVYVHRQWPIFPKRLLLLHLLLPLHLQVSNGAGWPSIGRRQRGQPTDGINCTRPKPPSRRQGLAGSWGQDTDEVSTFLVFLTSHFAPAALSSDLTNLGPLITMKIHLETLKTMETN